jgi:hypothetical protein
MSTTESLRQDCITLINKISSMSYSAKRLSAAKNALLLAFNYKGSQDLPDNYSHNIEIDWEQEWEKLLETQKSRNYKPSWLIYQCRTQKCPLWVWEELETMMGYKAGWSKYQYHEFTLGE